MVAPSPAHIEADALAGSSVQAVALAGARVSGRLSIAQAPINLFDFKTNDFLGTLDARFANAAPNVPSNVEIKVTNAEGPCCRSTHQDCRTTRSHAHPLSLSCSLQDGKVEFGYTSSNQILVDVETSGVVSLDFKSSAGWGNLRVTLSSDAFKGATAYRVIQDTSPGTADLKTSLSGDTLVIAIPEGRMRGTSVAGEFLYKIQLVAEGKPV